MHRPTAKQTMATAMTAPAAGAMVEGRSSSRDDAAARLHKDNAIEHWAKIKSLMEKKQVRFLEGWGRVGLAEAT